MVDLPHTLFQPLPMPEPQDVDYCGTLRLHVDASDALRRIFHVHEVLPVAGSGVLTVLLPKWLAGYHAPQAPIELLAGLEFEALGEQLHWTRHATEVHAFHIHVLEGAREIEARFQFLSPTESVSIPAISPTGRTPSPAATASRTSTCMAGTASIGAGPTHGRHASTSLFVTA